MSEHYKDLSGNSGVRFFQIGEDFIDVEFDDAIYRYDYSRPGKKHVEAMKKLGKEGKGLSTYISQRVKSSFAKKMKR